jgi:hypothetical protein
MRRLLAKFKLRNSHNVYETDLGFEVTQIDPHGAEYKYTVSREAADLLCTLCTGECVTTKEASLRLAPHAKKLALPYHYGHKLHYYTQEILLVLTASGRATSRKVGCGFKYQVTG